MTQTIAEMIRGRVHISADYGQGRRGKEKIFEFSKFTLEDLRDMITNSDQSDDGWPEDHYCLQALDVFAEANRNYIWRISSESGGGGAMDNVVEFHATYRDAVAEAMSQSC